MRPLGTGSRIVTVCGLLCLCVLAGCRSSGIDPTGQRIFAEPPLAAVGQPPPQDSLRYTEFPGGELIWDRSGVFVNPRRCVAPVGSDVVLRAGVVGQDDYLYMNQRVEWLLSPDSVGQLVDFGRGTLVDFLFADYNFPRKIDNHWVITSTSRRRLFLNRETPTPTDDVHLLRGQSWVTVTSPVEGSSHVTVYAPTVYGWHAQKETATIYWVDADSQFPSPAIVAAGGRHVFTTTVTRHTDGSPRAGWRVRYEITGGPPAGFAPDGASSIDVVTNEAGQASVEIFQTQPSAGTNQVSMRVVRPADGAGGKPFEVRSGTTSITWSAPRLAIRKTGPAVGSIGSTLVYRVTVSNIGDLPADNVTVTDEIPTGLELISTNPPSDPATGQLKWYVGRLEARQSRVFDVQLRASRPGTVTSCAEATGGGGLTTRECVTTVIGEPNLVLQILGPDTGTVGGEVQHVIVIENHGEAPATGLLIKDFFDAGLEYPGETSPVEKRIADLAPGRDHRVAIGFRLARPGTLGHTVEVTASGGIRETVRKTITVAPAAAPPAASQGAAPLGTRPLLSVTKTKNDEPWAEVGKAAVFRVLVRNTGDVPLTNVTVTDNYDRQLTTIETTEGRQVRNDGQTLVWTIPMLRVGETRQFIVKCNPEAVAAETINSVIVTSAEGADGRDDARVAIREAPRATISEQPVQPRGAGLSMVIHDFADSREVGQTVDYEIVVDNRSATAESGLVLEVAFPLGLEPVGGSLRGYPAVGSSVRGQQIEFQPVGALRGGGQLRYNVRARATAAGQLKVQARLTGKGIIEPLHAEQDTRVFSSP